MTDNAKSAGIAILNYAYHTCDQFAVPRSEMAELFTDLRDAVIIGQHDKPIPPDTHIHSPGNRTGYRLPPEVIQKIYDLRSTGRSFSEIAEMTGCAYHTVRYYIGPNEGNALDANIPIPESQAHGATDRRADDQVPPKV